VLCAKLRLAGDFDFTGLAKQTPGYVGADLAALTGAAGVIAVKRIFREIVEGKLALSPTQRVEPVDHMAVDVPLETASIETNPGTTIPSSLPSNSIAHFLLAHPDPLTEEQLEPIRITYADFLAALPVVQPSSKREGFTTIPNVTWADVGALHGIRDELHMSIIEPIKRPELFKKVGIDAPSGVLLWGPPGCGKTLLAKAVANESRANFISVKGPELLNKVNLPKIEVMAPGLICDCSSMLERVSELFDKSFRVQGRPRRVSSSSTSWMRSFQDETRLW
jgi:ribosome biogenesis ATPase